MAKQRCNIAFLHASLAQAVPDSVTPAMEVHPVPDDAKPIAPLIKRIPKLRAKLPRLGVSALQAGEQHRVLGQGIAISKQPSINQCPMQGNKTGGCLGLAVTVTTELEIPDVVRMLLDIGRLQL